MGNLYSLTKNRCSDLIAINKHTTHGVFYAIHNRHNPAFTEPRRLKRWGLFVGEILWILSNS
jgi:hypothetical protein